MTNRFAALVLLCLLTVPAAMVHASEETTRGVPPQVWEQIQKLTASDADGSEQFGSSVAVNGDTAVVGAPFDDDDGRESGSAYVFERDAGGPGNWGEIAKLTASDAEAGDEFGTSVAISGDTIVVTALYADAAAVDSGAAYIFGRNVGGSGNWGEVTQLVASDAGVNDQFGFSSAISGDTVVIGDPFDNDGGNGSGAAFIFERNAGDPDNWGEVAKLTASGGNAGDQLGYSVAISGDTAIAGALFDDDAGSDAGSAYIFGRDAGGQGNWGQVTQLTRSDAADDDWFGHSVAISGDTAIVGALFDDDAGFSSGSAYIFDQNTGGSDNWGEIVKLTASDEAQSDRFGHSVAIDGDTAMVGAIYNADIGAQTGAAYLFDRDEGGSNTWGEVIKLTASDAAAGDQFGHAVAVDGSTAIVGARFEGNPIDTGAAYVFDENLALLFVDGFESGNTFAWSNVVP